MEQSNTELRQEWALYLQVLREGLPMAVHQAVFHVATQRVPERYGALAEKRRVELQRRLQELVERCSDLLSLEQLITLTQQVLTEQKRLHRRDHRRLMAALADAGDDEATGEDPSQAEPLPPGSVRLGIDLPLSAELFATGVPGLVNLGSLLGSGPTRPTPDAANEADAIAEADADAQGHVGAEGEPEHGPGDHTDGRADHTCSGEADQDPDGEAQDDPDDDESLDPQDADGLDDSEDAGDDGQPFAETRGKGEERFALLRSRGGLQQLFAMASIQFGRDAARAEPDPADRPGIQEDGAVPVPFPQQPVALLHWWEALERALQRRLRNLSHAINLELLRLGLTQSLLPINLLDAVLEGQIEAMAAPANLLRLSLPFAPEGMATPLEAIGLLLRRGDLEFEQARLRTCRRRLERRRQDVRKMAQQYRHWQRRAQALEAEQQWLQDSQTNRPAPPG